MFRFGGDLELTEDEAKIKVKMQKLKSEFEGGNGGKGKDPKSVDAQRQKLSRELTEKLDQLKGSRNQNFLIFGALFVLMLLFSVFMCKKGSQGVFGKDDELLKSADFIKTEKEKLLNLKTKLQKMEKILIAKMDEMKLGDEVKKLNAEEKEANSKIKGIHEEVEAELAQEELAEEEKNLKKVNSFKSHCCDRDHH